MLSLLLNLQFLMLLEPGWVRDAAVGRCFLLLVIFIRNYEIAYTLIESIIGGLHISVHGTNGAKVGDR
jgi:hypothetical protein